VRSASGDLPALDDLATALHSAFGMPVTVLARAGHPYASSFPAEVVRCEAGGRELAVLCKYEAGRRYPCFGHRGGLGYEAMVYAEVVARLPLPSVTCHGSWTDTATGDTWLFLEHLVAAGQLNEHDEPDTAMAAAARWAGTFHRVAPGRPGAAPLITYTGEYYAQWARRASAIAGDWHRRLPWLRTLCARAEPALHAMGDLPSCVIHGEFTPHNVLVLGGEVFPVDWETAAVGVGAVDLAALTDGWPVDVVARCEAEYVRARWPDGPPADHGHTLDLARLYWDLRWVGDRPEWLAKPGMPARYAALLVTARRLGLV
jgi:Phosphotransferase enzyme family